MNPDCVEKSLALLAACLTASHQSPQWALIAERCAAIWNHARLAVECASSEVSADRPKWFLEMESPVSDTSHKAARLAILAKRGIESARKLESASEVEPSATHVFLAAQMLFRVVACHPHSTAIPVRQETVQLLSDINRLFNSNQADHENPNPL